MPVKYSAAENVVPVPGIRIAATAAGIKSGRKPDLTLVELCNEACCAAVFTQNAFCAAPVHIARTHLAEMAPRYLLINSGNANAGTGPDGERDALKTCSDLAELAGIRAQQVLPFSTGVIAKPLPVDRITVALPGLLGQLDEAAWIDGATGIMTTDTVYKLASQVVEVSGQTVTVTGMAKGSGMIRPDMATMLAFIGTDAKLESSDLQEMLEQSVARSFNCITVDGDTSTNDACVLIATGRSGVDCSGENGGESRKTLQAAIDGVCIELAQAIVRDGEGATKFVEVRVETGRDATECRQVAYTVAHSPLVKTALFASDPNWGRILAAIGRSGIGDLDIDRVDLYLNDVRLLQAGQPDPAYTESRGQAVMDGEEILIRICLQRGSACERIWTTDLSYDYVKINAEYRT